MSKRRIERRLTEIGKRLKELRSDAAVAEEQLLHLAETAEDARLRSLISETPVADREHRESARHAETMRRHRDEVTALIAKLEQQQDDLLDQFGAQSS